MAGLTPWAGGRRSVPWIGALLIAATAALAVFDTVRAYRAAVADTGRELDTQARIVAEQTARSLQAVDVVLRGLAREERDGALETLDEAALHHRLRERMSGLVQVEGLFVARADGNLRAVSISLPMPAAPRLTQYRFFERLRQSPPGTLYIGRASESPVDALWVFPIVLRLENAAGEFAGLAGARGRVDYFQRFYNDIRLGEGTQITLTHRDGTLLARHPAATAPALGQPDSLLQDLLRAQPDGLGVPRIRSAADHVERFGAVQMVPDYPIAVVVTRDASVALASWRAQAIGTALRTLALAALGALLLVLLMRQLAGLEQARRSLEVAQERFALAVSGANQGLWDWDLRTDQLFVSARAQAQLGLEPGEPLRSRTQWRASLVYHPDDEARVRKALSDHLLGRTPHFEAECRMHHASGQWRWVWQRGVAVRDAAGRATRLAGSMEDITDRKRAESERQALEGQLRQAQKLESLGTLAGGIAHDFNNILGAILGYGEMAQSNAAEGSTQRRHIDAVMSAGLRAKSLVERILAFSRSGVGERVPVHVESVVSEALELLEASLPRGMTLRRELHAPDAGVRGDPTQIHQVVMNLCANAVQASKTGGVLTVRTEAVTLEAPLVANTATLSAGRYVLLTVSDTGGGIAPHVLERIFDPFFTTKEVGVGTGLGLSLVHGIVADLGGGIAVDSRVGEGTRFRIYLPRQADVAPPPAAADAPLPTGHGETVMLVDDEEPLVRLGEEMMAALGYEPVGFSSAESALQSLRNEPERFHAVITDESMPGMTGSELARAVRVLRPEIPILMMSGDVTPALAERARAAGVTEVLSKPLVSRDIARSLGAALCGGAAARI